MPVIQRLLNRLRREIRLFYHAGGNLWCPVCEHSLRGFQPFPMKLRDELSLRGFDLGLEHFETLNLYAYTCPLCNASDRYRLYALYFESVITELPNHSGRRFIEFAPLGELTSKMRRLLGPNFEVRTADLFMDGVDDRVDLCDMKAIYADASVDMFLCSHVLEHVPDDRQALRELHRILKPGGRGLVMVPIHLDLEHTREGMDTATPESRCKYYSQGDHLRLHAKVDFIERIQSVGFKLQLVGAEHFGLELVQRCGIHENSMLYVVHKRN